MVEVIAVVRIVAAAAGGVAVVVVVVVVVVVIVVVVCLCRSDVCLFSFLFFLPPKWVSC